MEMPFDYVGGRNGDLPSEPTETLLGSFVVHDEDGEGYTVFALYRFNAMCDSKEISERVREMHPVWHCEHAHDCCAQFYPMSANWAWAENLDRFRAGATMTVIVEQRFLCNI